MCLCRMPMLQRFLRRRGRNGIAQVGHPDPKIRGSGLGGTGPEQTMWSVADPYLLRKGAASSPYCPHPCGAAKSRPSLESSFKAIRRRRPRASQIRRRLTALAGATDKRISGNRIIILHEVIPASSLGSAPGLIIIAQNIGIIKIVIVTLNLSLANRTSIPKGALQATIGPSKILVFITRKN